MLQPLTTKGIDLSKAIKTVETATEICDVYFTGYSWSFVAAIADTKYSTKATQDCTDAVRQAGQIIAPDGTVWSVADYEKANAQEFKGLW